MAGKIAAVALMAFAMSVGVAWAEDAAPEASQPTSTLGKAKEAVKESTRTVGHGTRDAAVAVGHATRDTAKAIGHGTRDAARAIGHGTRDAAKGTKKAVGEAWTEATGKGGE